MFRCDECEEVFEEPIEYTESHGEHFREVFTCSPCCKENYTEVEMCEFCDEYIDLYERLCDKCKSKLKKAFSNVLHENFTEFEIEILNDIFDGEELG